MTPTISVSGRELASGALPYTHIVISILSLCFMIVAYLEHKLHLSWHDIFHLCLLQDLVVGGIRGLSNVDDSPSETYSEF